MTAIYRWLLGALPFIFRATLNLWQAWIGIRLGLRLAIIGAVGALIPLPEWLEDLPSQIAALPPIFWFFADFIQLQYGVYVIITAYTFRWVWSTVFKGI